MSLELRAVRWILALSFPLLFAGCSNLAVEKCPYPSPIFDVQSARGNPVPVEPVKPADPPKMAQVQGRTRLAIGKRCQ